jgi:hypothetical protein
VTEVLRMKWAVIAIDWAQPNVISLWDTEAEARSTADRLDGLAMRTAVIPVPEGHPLLNELLERKERRPEV